MKDINLASVIIAVIGTALLLVVVLSGCAETGPHTSATDWRSIHQRSPDTGS